MLELSAQRGQERVGSPLVRGVGAGHGHRLATATQTERRRLCTHQGGEEVHDLWSPPIFGDEGRLDGHEGSRRPVGASEARQGSDAVGDAAYNRQLSERRAELVKQFFVDNFELSADQLTIEGLGEARPIASNATPQGRRANRRVDVLILN